MYIFIPIFLRKLNIFHCLVCIYYAILTYFLKKILKNLLSLFFSYFWRMSSEYEEEHFTSVSFSFMSRGLFCYLIYANLYAVIVC